MNVKRAFSRGNKRTKSSTSPLSNDWVDMQVSKARYILGLDSARAESSRAGSTSSTSTNKLRSVTFSEATTAPVQAVNTTDDVKAKRLSQIADLQVLIEFPPETDDQTCQRKPSDFSLQSQASSGSLESYYDKSRTPLNISQQTSDSSSRDFALRRGTPSIIAESVQETEHLRQLRLASKPDKRSSHDLRSSVYPLARCDDNSSARSSHHLAADTIPERSVSVRSKNSQSRISIIRGNAPAENKAIVPIRHTLEHENRPRSLQPVVDPTHAKLNVRRPKAGTKNWFDDVDSESDEELETGMEPQLEADFALRVENAFDQGNFDMIPPRKSSRSSRTVDLPGAALRDKDRGSVRNESRSICPVVVTGDSGRRRARFAGVDLREQSVLYLSSSESEEEEEQAKEEDYCVAPVKPVANLRVGRMNPNLAREDYGDSDMTDHRVSALRISVPTPSIPERNIDRLSTHLEEDSTDNLMQNEDVLTSFPRTPTDSFSHHTSFQSVTSEASGQRTSLHINLTKQEENLIAALRLKKSAMQRAQVMAHRQDALRILELDGNNDETSETHDKKQMISPLSPMSPLRVSYRHSTMSNGDMYRRDIEGILAAGLESECSNRSSMATYVTDTSQDVQILDGSVVYTPVAAPLKSRKTTAAPRSSQRQHRDFHSATTASSLTPSSTQSKHDRIANTWETHFRPINGLERHRTREDIPSQLFMEKPYTGWQGWEGRTRDLQMVAH